MKTNNLFLATILVVFGAVNKNHAQLNNYTAPQVNNIGSYNVFLGSGSGSGFVNTSGGSNTGVGMNSLRELSFGGNNVAVGTQSLSNLGIGSTNYLDQQSNVSIGYQSSFNLRKGSYNVSMGVYSMRNLLEGYQNVAIGYDCMTQATSTTEPNTVVGNFSLYGHLKPSGNVIFGRGGYSSNQNVGNFNIGLGNGVGNINTTGNNNITIGHGSSATTGDRNILIGNNTLVNSFGNSNLHNVLNIGNVLFGQNINNISSADNYYATPGRIGIRTSMPNNTLEIKSETANSSGLRFTNLTSASPSIVNSTIKVLSVNANGDVILVDDKLGTGLGTATTITAGQNIVVTGDSSAGYTISSPNTTITNTLVSNTNTMTSTVNGVVANAPIVNTVVNTVTSGQLTTTVNGVSSAPVSISSLTEVDGDITNELQNLGLSGNVLSISNGNSVTLPNLVDTDAQTLSITGNQLTISNGNSVNLPISNGSETIIQAGTNVTVTGNGTIATPYVINSTASGSGTNTNIYTNDGTLDTTTIPSATLGIRTVTMGNNNLFFKTTNSNPSFGRIYIGDATLFPTITTDSKYRLLVEGGILTEKVKVALRNPTTNWADYVFANDYKLMPLNEVETFVKTNKHLPGVSSAEDLVKNGIDLGEMQAKQMEKIEELTLYAIEQNKKIEKQEKEIEELKVLVKALVNKNK